MRFFLAAALAAAAFGQPFGTWKMNAARSTFAGEVQPRSLTVRIEPHAGGQALTLDRLERDGRNTSSSTILYLDGEPRQFDDFGCSGIQSSRRVDAQTLEILRMCTSGEWVRFILRSVPPTRELTLQITEQRSGRRFERRLVFERR